MSIKNSNDTIGNLTRDLPTCSAVPQPSALPCAPNTKWTNTKLMATLITFQLCNHVDVILLVYKVLN